MLSFKQRGLKRVIKKFNRAGGKSKSTMKDAMQESILFLHQETPGYPPPPPGSTYRRTLQLGRSITSMMGRQPGALSRVETLGSEVRGIWGTGVKYGPFVVDEKRQAKVHKGRWYTMQGVFRKNLKGIVKIFERRFKWPIR